MAVEGCASVLLDNDDDNADDDDDDDDDDDAYDFKKTDRQMTDRQNGLSACMCELSLFARMLLLDAVVQKQILPSDTLNGLQTGLGFERTSTLNGMTLPASSTSPTLLIIWVVLDF